jgi:hypothetical protein
VLAGITAFAAFATGTPLSGARGSATLVKLVKLLELVAKLVKGPRGSATVFSHVHRNTPTHPPTQSPHDLFPEATGVQKAEVAVMRLYWTLLLALLLACRGFTELLQRHSDLFAEEMRIQKAEIAVNSLNVRLVFGPKHL